MSSRTQISRACQLMLIVAAMIAALVVAMSMPAFAAKNDSNPQVQKEIDALTKQMLHNVQDPCGHDKDAVVLPQQDGVSYKLDGKDIAGQAFLTSDDQKLTLFKDVTKDPQLSSQKDMPKTLSVTFQRTNLAMTDKPCKSTSDTVAKKQQASDSGSGWVVSSIIIWIVIIVIIIIAAIYWWKRRSATTSHTSQADAEDADGDTPHDDN